MKKELPQVHSDDPEFKLTSTLVFDNPVSDDIGVYTCMCTNGYQGNSFTDLATVEFGVGEFDLLNFMLGGRGPGLSFLKTRF